ncbi:hypothetical protein GCM10009825_35520 [Arthrobacter humicola]|uniref:Uncharacterized protein n=1 Tax=Arthrobacter humicola TaxID=409291 RepID=A0ABN2ZLZ9_9MICC
MQGRNPAGCLDRGSGTADHDESLAFEEFLQPAPDQLVIVKDKDAYNRRHAIGCSETCI